MGVFLLPRVVESAIKLLVSARFKVVLLGKESNGVAVWVSPKSPANPGNLGDFFWPNSK